MKRILFTLLTSFALFIGFAGVSSVASAAPCDSACKVNNICASTTTYNAAYRAAYCPVYGKGGLYCVWYGWNC